MPSQQPQQTPRRRRRQATSRFLSQRALLIGFVAVALIALAVFFLRRGARPDLAGVARADPANVELVVAGENLYATRCAGCHGAAAAGATAPALNAAGTAWQHDDQWLFTTIKRGGQATAPPGATSAMPAFESLTDGQVWAVLAYIKSTWPTERQTAQPQGR
jgi:mono/diheme cytochrome c family protein